MGVPGLWRLIEASGKPVPLETLENKVLAVDVSIWLHQAIKGFQDSKGQTVQNAHLLCIYHRLCKLLFYKIRPVFVFDGGVPALKKQVIAKRHQLRTENHKAATGVQKQLIKALLKHAAVKQILSENVKAKIGASSLEAEAIATSSKKYRDDIYKLPPIQVTEDSVTHSDDDEYKNEENSSESDAESSSTSPIKQWDLHTIDEKSEHFRSLPVEMRHEILTELKETRKQSSWGRIHELPRQIDGFSGYQMRRLLKRHSVQTSLEELEKEMGGHSLSLAELEGILLDQGVIQNRKTTGQRIASDENTRFLLIKDVQKAIEDAKRALQVENKTEEHAVVEENVTGLKQSLAESETSQNDVQSADVELEHDIKKAIELSLQEMPSTSKRQPTTDYLQNFKDEDFVSCSDSDESDFISTEENTVEMKNTKTTFKPMLTQAKNYMMEYSGLSLNAIGTILGEHTDSKDQKANAAESLNQTELFSETKSQETQNDGDNSQIAFMSESDDSASDFLDVGDNTKHNLEIVIDPKHVQQDDDMFADLFQCTDTDKVERELGQVPEVNKITHILSESAQSTNADNIGHNQVSVKCTENELVKEKCNTMLTSETFELQKADGSNGNAKEVESVDKVQFVDEVPESASKRAKEIKDIVANFIKEHVDLPNKIEESASNVQTNTAHCASDPSPVVSLEQLKTIDKQLHTEQRQLEMERSNKERLAKNISDQMYQEAQELLELFGVPYLIAPMEAEAQCAFLNEINLTDGTITDDSDIWLFGGRTVYKDFFNQNKFVKQFKSDDIQQVFKLTREQLILFAMLVGSDYTTGLQGVGPVTALEILAAFPSGSRQSNFVTGLQEFRGWLIEGKKAGPSGRTTLRNKLKNVRIVDNFPSAQVVQAYLQPSVDSSRDPFTWGQPDVPALVEFAKRKFGWKPSKSEEILGPIMRRMQDKTTQKTILNYFEVGKQLKRAETGSFDEESVMSKRVKKALDKLGKDPENVDKADEDVEMEILKETKRRSRKKECDIMRKVEKELNDTVKQGKKIKERTANLLHKKEFIPQKERDKSELMRAKLKAIEVFRKSKQGPGYVAKRKKLPKQMKEEAELSENSSSE